MSPRRGTAVLVLFVLLAVSACACQIAGATGLQPEYRTCKKLAKVNGKYTGGFNNKTCTQVNGAGEGKYAIGAVPTPFSFTAIVKQTSFFYYTPAHGIAWQVKCSIGQVKGVITGPATSAETLSFENCAAHRQSGGKAAECSGHPTATIETALVELLPGGDPGVLVYPGFVKDYTCEGVTFGEMVGFEVGAVENGGKGLAGVFAVDASGKPALTEFYDFEEREAFDAFLESEVTESPVLDVGLQMVIPLGPKSEVVVIDPAP